MNEEFNSQWRDPQERIAFLTGRPERESAIGSDDVFNLRIALGLHRDVLELCRDPHLFEDRTAPVHGR